MIRKKILIFTNSVSHEKKLIRLEPGKLSLRVAVVWGAVSLFIVRIIIQILYTRGKSFDDHHV